MPSHAPVRDLVDDILDQWFEEQPALDMDALGVVVRVMTLNRRFADDASRALEPLGLELFEYDVLSALRRQGSPFSLPATALARETELSSGAMTNRINRLEERGLVSRRADPGDRRSVIVRLTAKGRRTIDDAIHVRLEAAREALESLNKTELRRLASLLRSILVSSDED